MNMMVWKPYTKNTEVGEENNMNKTKIEADEQLAELCYDLLSASTILHLASEDRKKDLLGVCSNFRKKILCKNDESEYHRCEATKHLQACTTNHLKVIHEWLDDRLTP